MRSGVIGLFSQNLILMGTFFVVPLYLQLVLGLDALETGIKMLPISITMLVTAGLGARLSNRFPVRTIVRTGLVVTIAGVLILLATIQPTLSDAGFAIGMGVLGIGMGLMISQLGNVIQSSVDESGRSEAGGLQFTGQQLGSALGVAFIGAIVLIGLTNTFVSTVEQRLAHQRRGVATQVSIAAGNGINFVSSDQDRDRRTGRGPRQGHDGRGRRRLRNRPTPITQSRPPRRGLSRPHLPRIHRRPTPRATRPPKERRIPQSRRTDQLAVTYREFFSHVVDVVEAVGATILIVGGLGAFARYVREIVAPRGQDAFGDLRKNLGRVILLGLEVLIIADIIRTIVVDQSVESVVVLGTIVLIRVILSFSLEVEIDGMWPWNRWRIPPDKPLPDES